MITDAVYQEGVKHALAAVRTLADRQADDNADAGIAAQHVRTLTAEVAYQLLGGRNRPEDQPPPVPNSHATIHEQVCVDLMERQAVGITRYGQALQPHNGRDALRDAYDEILDLAAYLKQCLIERETS